MRRDEFDLCDSICDDGDEVYDDEVLDVSDRCHCSLSLHHESVSVGWGEEHGSPLSHRPAVHASHADDLSCRGELVMHCQILRKVCCRDSNS